MAGSTMYKMAAEVVHARSELKDLRKEVSKVLNVWEDTQNYLQKEEAKRAVLKIRTLFEQVKGRLLTIHNLGTGSE